MRIFLTPPTWIVVILAFITMGCSSDSNVVEVTHSAYSGTVPTFSGPYASEFEYYFVNATSEFVRAVLEDGEVTDSEYAEMEARFTSCLADEGVEFKGFKPDGSFDTSNASQGNTNDIIDVCSESSGHTAIGALHDFMYSNPDNIPPETRMAECLVAAGVVPPDYDADDYSQDMTTRFTDLSALESELYEALRSCS
jgi:hypothetical protein